MKLKHTYFTYCGCLALHSELAWRPQSCYGSSLRGDLPWPRCSKDFGTASSDLHPVPGVAPLMLAHSLERILLEQISEDSPNEAQTHIFHLQWKSHGYF